MQEIKILVSGMMCEGCERRIVNALGTIDGVSGVIANHENGTVIIKAQKIIDKKTIEEKIADLGFTVKED